MEKKKKSTKWIIICAVVGVLLVVGAIRSATSKPAAADPPAVSADVSAQSDPEPEEDGAQAALSEAFGGASLLFDDSVRNDKTGKWRMLRVSSAVPVQDVIDLYVAAYIRANDEVHIVINFALGTTTVITGSGTYVSVYEYVDGEEHDAALIPSGEKLADYIYSGGKLEAVE